MTPLIAVVAFAAGVFFAGFVFALFIFFRGHF